MTTGNLVETSLVFCNRSPNIMSYPMTRTRSPRMKTMPVSVKRRYTGPYKPCPRAKRYALMDKPENILPTNRSQTVNEVEENLQVDECVDFAVESTKINDPESSVQIIDSDEEDASDAGEVSRDTEDQADANSHNELHVDQDIVQHTSSVAVKEVLPLELPTSTKLSFETEKFVPKIIETKKWKTYNSHGFKLRCCRIILINCSHIINKCRIDADDNHHSSLKEILPCTSSTPTKETVNTIKTITKDVSTPEFTEKYEDAVAQKLRSLRKRLDTSSQSTKSALKPTSTSADNDASPCRKFIPMSNTQTPSSQPPTPSPNSSEKQPVHPRTKLTLAQRPTLMPNNLNKYSLRRSKQQNYIELLDSDTESSIVTMSTDIKVDDDIKTEEEESMLSEYDNRRCFDGAIKSEIPVKPEIKSEEPCYESKSYYFESDEELLTDLFDAYNKVERRRRKCSSNHGITVVSRTTPLSSPVKPSLIRLSPLKSPGNKYKMSPFVRYNSIQSTSSSSSSSDEEIGSTCKSSVESGCRPKRYLAVKVVNLRKETVRNLIKLCSKSADWNDDSLLQKAGMRQYDINRLGIVTRSRRKASYGLRRFVKKKKTYELITVEKPKTLPSSNSEKQLNSKALKALKHKLKLQERKEQKQKEKESIRRALLRINSRLMNQNKFFAFLNQGSSSDKPIIL